MIYILMVPTRPPDINVVLNLCRHRARLLASHHILRTIVGLPLTSSRKSLIRPSRCVCTQRRRRLLVAVSEEAASDSDEWAYAERPSRICFRCPAKRNGLCASRCLEQYNNVCGGFVSDYVFEANVIPRARYTIIGRSFESYAI